MQINQRWCTRQRLRLLANQSWTIKTQWISKSKHKDCSCWKLKKWKKWCNFRLELLKTNQMQLHVAQLKTQITLHNSMITHKDVATTWHDFGNTNYTTTIQY